MRQAQESLTSFKPTLSLYELAHAPLHRIVASGEIDSKGRLSPVGGVGAKAAAAMTSVVPVDRMWR